MPYHKRNTNPAQLMIVFEFFGRRHTRIGLSLLKFIFKHNLDSKKLVIK